MLLRELFESPDFGYKMFVDRDDDIAKLIWNVEFEKDGSKLESIIIRALSNVGKTEMLSNNGLNREGIIIIRRNGEKFQITRSQLTQYRQGHEGWASTGLGQLLYDKAVAECKKAGIRYLMSDYTLSIEARKAWKKLATRYPVTKETDSLEGDKVHYFQIDLSKV